MSAAMSLAEAQTFYRCSPADSPNGSPSRKRPSPKDPGVFDDLPFKVELWDLAKSGVESIIAVTASGNIGFAAYHAATREFPDRHIVLRRHDTVLAQWNGPNN